MASTTNFRNGFTFEMDGHLFSIAEFQHVKPGKGGAFVRTKLKNIRTGAVIEKTFRSGEKVKDVRLERKSMEYLYSSGDEYHMMDPDTYEQFPIRGDVIGDGLKYLKENMNISILMNGSDIISIEVPTFVELKITETEPSFKGDTVTAGTKPATLETGAVVPVPLFLQQGDKIKVDTRTDTYIERVKK
ncbi:MAG: elongation factor P [Candidatus Cloacimonetes bacterium 4572_55]|nr:MAG: elongation factor P [Candidatus Cloacimonetes bacterium 4572_55]